MEAQEDGDGEMEAQKDGGGELLAAPQVDGCQMAAIEVDGEQMAAKQEVDGEQMAAIARMESRWQQKQTAEEKVDGEQMAEAEMEVDGEQMAEAEGMDGEQMAEAEDGEQMGKLMAELMEAEDVVEELQPLEQLEHKMSIPCPRELPFCYSRLASKKIGLGNIGPCAKIVLI